MCGYDPFGDYERIIDEDYIQFMKGLDDGNSETVHDLGADDTAANSTKPEEFKKYKTYKKRIIEKNGE